MDRVSERMSALKRYKIMDTDPEQSYDDLTRLASYICQTPMTVISLLDDRRQWFKSKVGLHINQTPIEHAFCGYAIRYDEVMIVPDAKLDPRFSDNPLVAASPNIRFYAGAPLITPEGVPLGTLCAMDTKVRELSSQQIDALIRLARQVISQLELRLYIEELSRAI